MADLAYNEIIAEQIKQQGGVEGYLLAQQHKGLLRFLTCGNVDDGKSTWLVAYYMTLDKFMKINFLCCKMTVSV